MIGLFTPVNNTYWFELRNIEQIEKGYIIYPIAIEPYIWNVDEFPIFKCLKDCNKLEYKKQFKQYF